MPPARRVPGRHRTPESRAEGPGRHRGEPSRAERQAQTAASREQAARRTRVRTAARGTVRGPGRLAQAVTVRKGGQHALMAEFLAFLAIVTMRAIADYVPADQGQPTEGTSKGTVTPHGKQIGPLPTLAAGFVIFFILGFMAARGGASARVAAVAGLIIDVVLLLNSMPELDTVSQSFGNARQQAQQATGTTQAPGTDTAAGRG